MYILRCAVIDLTTPSYVTDPVPITDSHIDIYCIYETQFPKTQRDDASQNFAYMKLSNNVFHKKS